MVCSDGDWGLLENDNQMSSRPGADNGTAGRGKFAENRADLLFLPAVSGSPSAPYVEVTA